MKILILNAEAGGNKGAEAMLETLILKLSENFTKKITLVLEVASNFSYYENIFLKRFNNENVSFELISFKPKKLLFPYGNGLDGISVAVDIGGINFHDGSKKAHLRNLVRFRPIIKRNIKLIFFTQDIGPSSQLFTKIIGSYILKKAIAVFTRSQKSYDSATNYFKVDKDKVLGPFPDATFLYSPNDNSVFEAKTTNYIVLSPSAIMYVKHGEEYLNLFVNLYKELSKEYEVIGLVHNFTKNDGSSDAFVLKEINNRLEGDMNIINENVSTGELKAFLNNSKFIISSRYHVVVGAVTKNVPGIAIGWNPKYESFLGLYNKTEWNIDFNSTSFEKILFQLNNSLFKESGQFLKERNKELKKDVQSSYDKLFKLIG